MNPEAQRLQRLYNRVKLAVPYHPICEYNKPVQSPLLSNRKSKVSGVSLCLPLNFRLLQYTNYLDYHTSRNLNSVSGEVATRSRHAGSKPESHVRENILALQRYWGILEACQHQPCMVARPTARSTYADNVCTGAYFNHSPEKLRDA